MRDIIFLRVTIGVFVPIQSGRAKFGDARPYVYYEEECLGGPDRPLFFWEDPHGARAIRWRVRLKAVSGYAARVLAPRDDPSRVVGLSLMYSLRLQG